MHALELTLILLGASIGMVALARRFNMPALVGYLAVGVIVGPYVGNLAGDAPVVATFAELGVVFLMFSLGLEFSLPKLASLRGYVFGLGAAQVASTIALMLALVLVLPAAWLRALIPGGLDWRGAVVLGGALAMSSTALVSTMLAERRELESEHGRRAFGILLFQDLALIPLLIVTPALAGGNGDWWLALLVAAAKAALVLFLLLKFGPALMGSWFLGIARLRSHEIFTLNVLFATILLAWLTEQAGLSLELGAFVAGMLISETEYRFQVEEDIKPFRDLLLGLFFITIGMKLDMGVVWDHWGQVLLLLTVPVLMKFGLVFGIVRASRAGAPTAIRTGIWLAQAGEFAFVLLVLALNAGVIGHETVQPVLAAMLLSILISPFLIAQADRIALRTTSQEWLQRSVQLQQVASRALSRERHVIVCGFGRSGQNLAHVLEAEGVPMVALDLDPDRVRLAASAGESVVFGDASRRETLVAAGVHRASAVVVTYSDTVAARKLLAALRPIHPTLPVLIRATRERDIEALRQAGATEVVPEIVEGSLILASHALALSGVSLARVAFRIRAIRDDRYQMLRGYFHGAGDESGGAFDEDQPILHAVTIPSGSLIIGRALGEIPLQPCRLTALVRDGKRLLQWPDELAIRAGDTLVIAGTPDQVSGAETHLLKR